MKIVDALRDAERKGTPAWSFEFFPPKTAQGVANLYDRLERMYALGPTFIDVTWGAGGSTADTTLELCAVAQQVLGLETCMHLTCTNMPVAELDRALTAARDAGVQNILALRGDPPRGQCEWTACAAGFAHAIDLVRHIRDAHGDYFGIAVAGYPEGHAENPDRHADLLYLKAKVDAGADYIVTQMFYDVDLFLAWVDECRAVGISCPIVPGIMPIQTYGGFRRMTTLAKTKIPQHIEDALAPIKDDDQLVKDYGIRLAIDMCRQLADAGITAFHFYTMNLERSVRLILEGLGFVAPPEVARPLPWNPSKAARRANENVRPIFWRNRTRSYIIRTEAWDEFPNGRWGDARSPAYGELDGWGIALKHTRDQALDMWGKPTTPHDLAKVFEGFCRGHVAALPWSDTPLAAESCEIRDLLARANLRGFLTINSQPRVNGAPSTHPVHGWGPRHGYVYQKAYLEFFVPRSLMVALERVLEHDEVVTYHAVNRSGALSTNHATECPNAVTWGVFPAHEILQPTIVDVASFMAWKDEAFALWDQWRSIYPHSTAPHQFLGTVASEWYLVNVVHNDFTLPDAALFDVLEQAAQLVDAGAIPEDAMPTRAASPTCLGTKPQHAKLHHPRNDSACTLVEEDDHHHQQQHSVPVQ